MSQEQQELQKIGPPRTLTPERMGSLLDLTATLHGRISVQEVLDAVLHTLAAELSPAWILAYARDGGRGRLTVSRDAPPSTPSEVDLGAFPGGEVLRPDSGGPPTALGPLGAEVLCPIRRSGRTLAVLALGPRADGRSYGAEGAGFLETAAASAAPALENAVLHGELRGLSQRLSAKAFHLGDLLDAGRELTASLDESSIPEIVTSAIMGHLMVSRCGLYLERPEGLYAARECGVACRDEAPVIGATPADAVLEGLTGPRAVRDLPPGPLRDRLERARMSVVLPLGGRDGCCGLLAAGERASGTSFTDEDLEFAQALGRQAMAAMDAARLHRVRVEKERQDRELQIAREIQRSLLPRRFPEAPGLEFAAESESCQEVGGDYYDLFALDDGRVALAVGDVSGKGTPASILMASVHASLRALAGTAPIDVVLERVNRFLFESTPAGRYATLFYGELDPGTRRLRYVSAGHVPPFRLRRGGRRERLHVGGPALGLIEEATFTVCEVTLEPGDVLAVVTDGATEAFSSTDVELGEDGVFGVLESQAGGTAAATLRALLDAVHAWTVPARCSDDLTALVVKGLAV